MSVLVFADQFHGKIKKSAFEVITYASKIAPGNVTAIVFGDIEDAELSALGSYGASKVLHVKEDAFKMPDEELYSKALIKAAENTGAQVVVFSFDNTGKALSARVAAGLNAGLVAGATSLPDTSNGFTVRKNVFSGKAIAEVEILTDKKVIAVSPNSIPVEKGGSAAAVEVYSPGISSAPRVKVLEVKKNEGEIALPEAEVVVSAGRGMKGPENWGMIEDLAQTLGAATACSRPVSDIGWRPHHEHVGQTGLTVRPNLYIAIGISGAIQHLAGVNGSKTIVVINKDPEAPFFKAADYGVLGDAFEVVPKLNEAVKKFKTSQQ